MAFAREGCDIIDVLAPVRWPPQYNDRRITSSKARDVIPRVAAALCS